jgi:uncharacterized protein YjbI with pentapeptide repeats
MSPIRACPKESGFEHHLADRSALPAIRDTLGSYHAIMADAHHLSMLDQGSKIWNQWRLENPRLTPDLSHADLKRREFREFNLSGSDLHDSELTWAHVIDCNCEGADFNNSVLISTNFTGTELKGSNFRRVPAYGLRFLGTQI